MKIKLIAALLCTAVHVSGQQGSYHVFDVRHWGTVLTHPEMKNVVVKPDITFLSDGKGTLKMDVYLPPGLQAGDVRPAVVFLNAVGDVPGEPKVKSWGIYSMWPRLVAAHGLIAVSMECDRTRIQESLAGIFAFIGESGAAHHIDKERLGVYAASANVTQTTIYLMGENAYPGIKAAVLYYGRQMDGPYRKDLPVYFVIPEGDARGANYSTLWNEVLKNKAPWTIQMASGLVHAFDAFNDSDDARRVLKQTIAFWQSHLQPMPPQAEGDNALARAIIAARYGGDNAKASALLKEWIEEHPDDQRALHQYANVLKNQKQYAEAEPFFRKVIAADPANVNAKADLVVTLFALAREAEARKLLHDIGTSRQATKDVYVNIAIGLYILANHAEGVKLFEKILDMNPSGNDYYNLACGYARLGQKEKAFPALAKAVDLGYTNKQQYEHDGDLDSLRDDQRYKDLVAKLK